MELLLFQWLECGCLFLIGSVLEFVTWQIEICNEMCTNLFGLATICWTARNAINF
jgi:hypothetical protein